MILGSTPEDGIVIQQIGPYKKLNSVHLIQLLEITPRVKLYPFFIIYFSYYI